MDKIIEYMVSIKKRNVNERIRQVYEGDNNMFHLRITQITSGEVAFDKSTKNQIESSFEKLERLLKINGGHKEKKFLCELTKARKYIDEIWENIKNQDSHSLNPQQIIALKDLVYKYEIAYENMFVHTGRYVIGKVIIFISLAIAVYIIYLSKPNIDAWIKSSLLNNKMSCSKSFTLTLDMIQKLD
ncbi:MAG: hypothetical protein QG673_316 [Pseudomonadota bacterium]|nr:hypothetical protein [Pseudomonadota bacterium]